MDLITDDVNNFIRHLPPHDATLSLEHNPHLGLYLSVAQWIDDRNDFGGMDWCSEESKHRAIASNEFWTIFWNPSTPVGSYSLAAHTLVELLQAVKGL